MLKEVGNLSLRHYRYVVVAGMREMTVEGTEESHARCKKGPERAREIFFPLFFTYRRDLIEKR